MQRCFEGTRQDVSELFSARIREAIGPGSAKRGRFKLRVFGPAVKRNSLLGRMTGLAAQQPVSFGRGSPLLGVSALGLETHGAEG